MYPKVPAKCVVFASFPLLLNRASPKSPNFAFKSASSNTLLALMSLWIITSTHSSCKYANASATSIIILTLCFHVKIKSEFELNNKLSKLKLGM
ncbi:hypothetical protein HanIR_Chr01g0011321 [Helianthus annuus]|nr:hypothetical protein HanIR_Chr01g0011321 [Helianthus annuus]